MNNISEDLKNPPTRLPEIALPTLEGGIDTPIRPPGRRSGIITLVHALDCPGCGSHLAALAARQADFDEWDGHVLVIAHQESSTGDSAGEAARPFPTLLDAESRLSSRLGLEPPGTIIADQWGVVHEIHSAGAEHHFLTVDELVEWVRYLAIQCPECEGEAF